MLQSQRNLIGLLVINTFLACTMGSNLLAQKKKFVPNYDEAKVPEFELPPILNANQEFSHTSWNSRRAEILEQFCSQMYGYQPTSEFDLACEILDRRTVDFGKAKAIQEQYQVKISTKSGELKFDLLIYTPESAKRPVPAFLGLNFFGNHTVASNENIAISSSWSRNSNDKGVVNNQPTAKGRGTSKSRWPVEMIIEQGFGVATVYCGDIDPDFHDEFENGVHALFPEHKPSVDKPDRWGTIAAWAWGLSRALDCLNDHIDSVDGEKVVVIGHSRLGKTSFWAAATDTRFAAAISNDSGCGGAALSRRAFGETVQRINDSFPHWFCGNFKQYNLNEQSLPIDQHQLIALIAPRPVYVASASDDRWADPKGEFLSLSVGQEIHTKLGVAPLAIEALPEPNTASIGPLSYHLRQGKHDINSWDWANYLEFASKIF